MGGVWHINGEQAYGQWTLEGDKAQMALYCRQGQWEIGPFSPGTKTIKSGRPALAQSMGDTKRNLDVSLAGKWKTRAEPSATWKCECPEFAGGNSPAESWVIDPYPNLGNSVMFINDCRESSERYKLESKLSELAAKKQNACFETVHVRGWPYIAVFGHHAGQDAKVTRFEDMETATYAREQLLSEYVHASVWSSLLDVSQDVWNFDHVCVRACVRVCARACVCTAPLSNVDASFGGVTFHPAS